MDIKVVQGDISQVEADCIVVNLFEGVPTPGGATGVVDRALDGAIQNVISGGDFTGSANTSVTLYTNGQILAPRVLVLGLGARESFDTLAARKASAAAARAVSRLKGVRTCATIVHGAGFGQLDSQAAAQVLAEGMLLATYQSPQYRRSVESRNLSEFIVVEYDAGKIDTIQAGVQAGAAIAQGVASARDYVSEPPNILTPIEFATRAQTMAKSTGLKYALLTESEMSELGMGMLLAVTRGSANPPRFIILEHEPDGTENEQPLILIGKGITFDTGGISIKSSQNMWYMKDDMGGAAAVIGAMEAIGRLNVPRRVIGIGVCVENMPDGNAYRPGDILTGITGKTAEIISTDAEGRLVLADALGYVARYNPSAVVDLATLTGAVGVALGDQAAGLFANDQPLQDALSLAAARSGERLWPMPMYDEYNDDIKSDMAEVKNSGGRSNGVSTSAKFIEHFTEGYPWAHLDIASMVWSDSDKDPLTPKGATGYGVRLLVELAKTT